MVQGFNAKSSLSGLAFRVGSLGFRTKGGLGFRVYYLDLTNDQYTGPRCVVQS